MPVAVFHIFGVEFDLETIDAVAAGTFLLAMATFVLALFTYRLLRAAEDDRTIALAALSAAERHAEVAQRQAEVAERTLAVQIQPALVEVPVDLVAPREHVSLSGVQTIELPVGGVYADFVSGGSEIFCAVPFLNAGRGTAAIWHGWVEIAGPRGFPASDFARPNVPPGSRTHAYFRFRRGEPGFEEVAQLISRRDRLLVAIQYSDLSRRQTRITRFLIGYAADAPNQWTVLQVAVGDPDTGEIPPPGAQET